MSAEQMEGKLYSLGQSDFLICSFLKSPEQLYMYSLETRKLLEIRKFHTQSEA